MRGLVRYWILFIRNGQSSLVWDLDGVLLEVLVVGNVVVNGLLDDVGSSLAVLVDPFLVQLLVALGSVLL